MKSNIWKNKWPVWKERATVMSPPTTTPSVLPNLQSGSSCSLDGKGCWKRMKPGRSGLHSFEHVCQKGKNSHEDKARNIPYRPVPIGWFFILLFHVFKYSEKPRGMQVRLQFPGAAVSISVFPRARPHGRIWNKSRQAGIAHNTHAIRHHQDVRRRTCTRHLSENHWPTTIYVWTLRTSPPTKSDLCAELFRKSPLQPPGKPIRPNPPLTSFSNSHQSLRLYDNFPEYLSSITPYVKRSIFRARYNEVIPTDKQRSIRMTAAVIIFAMN